MDIKTIRLNNLELLIDEFQSAAEVAKRAGTDPSYISQIRTKRRTVGGTQRGVGDDLARSLERGCGKPPGWMDRQHGTAAQDLIREESPPYGAQPKISKELAIEVAARLKGRLQQDWLDANVQEAGNMLYLLINAYGETTHGSDQTETEGRSGAT